MNDYTRVISRSAQEFEASAPPAADLADSAKFTKSGPEDLRAIERLLDVQPGTLVGDDYYLQRVQCGCGRLLTMYDFVFTALVDAGHSKSFVLHTFVGTKNILNPPRGVRCSACAVMARHPTSYTMGNYRCEQHPK